MKNIILHIQDIIRSRVPAIRHADKNWGQLNIPQPPVKFPCALIDILSVDYSQTAHSGRLATATLSVTLADQHLARSSANAPSRTEAFAALDTVQQLADALDGVSIPGTCQQLVLTSLRKDFADASYDVYSLTFSTAWTLQKKDGEAVKASPSMSVSFKPPTH